MHFQLTYLYCSLNLNLTLKSQIQLASQAQNHSLNLNPILKSQIFIVGSVSNSNRNSISDFLRFELSFLWLSQNNFENWWSVSRVSWDFRPPPLSMSIVLFHARLRKVDTHTLLGKISKLGCLNVNRSKTKTDLKIQRPQKGAHPPRIPPRRPELKKAPTPAQATSLLTH